MENKDPNKIPFGDGSPIGPTQGIDASFGKKEKLKSQKRIAQIFEKGQGITAYPLKLMYLTLPDQAVSIKAGVTVSKRNFKSAVHRNRIKRLLREAYRLNKAPVFNNTDAKFAFLFLYLGRDMPTFEELNLKMGMVLNKFKVQINEKNNQ